MSKRKFWLAGLLALLPSIATATVTVSGSGGAGPNSASRTRTVSWVNGDSSDSIAIPNQCAVWRGSFIGTSAAASVYALDGDGSAAASTGTLLASFSTASALVTTFETAYPWIKVDVTDDPASGTARLYLYCVQEASSGGSNPFGLSGSSLTNESLAAIRTMGAPANYERVGGWTTYYFSNASGGDFPAGSPLNPGTVEEPMDESLIDNYCGRAGVMCVLDSGDNSFLITDGVSNGVIFPISSTNCPNVDEPCSVVRGSRTNTQVIVNGVSGAANVFSNTDTTGGGWAVVAGIRCIITNGDCFSTQSGAGGVARMLLVNTSAQVTGNGADNCYTNHMDDRMVILNGACEEVAGTGDNPGLGLVHGSSTVAIGLTNTNNVGTTGDAVIVANSGTVSLGATELVLIDGFIDRGTGSAALTDSVIELNPDAGGIVNTTLAKVGMTAGAGGACVRFTPASATETINFTMYQTTMTGCTDAISLAAANVDPAAVINIVGDGFTCDDTADDCVALDDNDWATSTSFLLTNYIFDGGEAGTIFTIGGGTPSTADTAANFQTGLSSVGTRTPLSVTSGAVDTNAGNAQWSDGTNAAPQLNCNENNECFKAYDSSYIVTLPFTIPEFVFGSRVGQAVLNGTDGNIGR